MKKEEPIKKRIKIFVSAGIISAFSSMQIEACPVCRRQVNYEIFDQNFFSNLFLILMPVLILFAAGFGLYFSNFFSTIFNGDNGNDERH